MDNIHAPSHPDTASLLRFAQGRLQSAAMRRVERHVRDCDQCLQAALAAPEDRLVRLLRRAGADRAADGSVIGVKAEEHFTPTTEAPARIHHETEGTQ